MSWNDANELVVGGTGQIYVAPVGTTLPTTPTGVLNSAFEGTGFTTEDGVSFSASPDIQEFPAWQARQAVRREMNTQEAKASFVLQQWNEVTLPLAFGGGTITDLGGGSGYRFDPPEDGDAIVEKSMVIDIDDGDDRHRFVIVRGSVQDAVESVFNRATTSQLPVGFGAMEPAEGGGPWYFLTNSTAFAAGS